MTAVSDYLGFSSLSHFARVFHKYMGTSPSEYWKLSCLNHPAPPLEWLARESPA